MSNPSLSKRLKILQARRLKGPDAEPFLNARTKEALDKLSSAGQVLTPHYQEPCGMIGIVAFPDGTLHFKAELLPAGKELDYAIEMLEQALAQLHQTRTSERLKRANGFLKLPEAVSAI